ncbi:GNAT family N-acetyltransferase [bacterium]|nr:GNAT family N-acetyltransferase [bacterium]
MLIGKNIHFQPVGPQNARLLAGWQSDPAFMGEFYNVWPITTQSMEKSLSDPAKNTIGHYIFFDSEKKEAIGQFGCFTPYTHSHIFQSIEIFYQLHPKSRGKGLATQAVCIMINHLFNSLTSERIQATVIDGNVASCRVLEKSGMVKEGTLRKLTFLKGKYIDMDIFSIIRDDWISEKVYRSNHPEF